MAKNNLTRAVPLRHRRALTRLCFYALAFSTLLSSQGTDAHLWTTYFNRVPRGPLYSSLPGRIPTAKSFIQIRPFSRKFWSPGDFGLLPDISYFTGFSVVSRIGGTSVISTRLRGCRV
jgi:hypothetical protein